MLRFTLHCLSLALCGMQRLSTALLQKPISSADASPRTPTPYSAFAPPWRPLSAASPSSSARYWFQIQHLPHDCQLFIYDRISGLTWSLVFCEPEDLECYLREFRSGGTSLCPDCLCTPTR